MCWFIERAFVIVLARAVVKPRLLPSSSFSAEIA